MDLDTRLGDMWIFKSARIRLTAWYILIITFISLSFSFIIYRFVSFHLEEGFTVAEYRLRGVPIPNKKVEIILGNELTKAKKDFLFRLLFVNGLIITGSGVGAYFLAGKTLDPIEEMMEGQKRFIADASHEFRTPITALKTEIEVALRDKKMTLLNAKKYLKSNLEETNKLEKLVDYLLSLNRLENSAESLNKRKIQIDRLVREVVKFYKLKAQKKGLALTYSPKKVFATVDEGAVRQLVSVLLDNALKYTLKGKVGVSVYKLRGKIQIEVKDTGIGMTRTDLVRIFDRFYRAEASRTKTGEDGYGLGLSIAKSIMDAHGGEIKVQSSKKGSTFIAVFPQNF